MEGLFEMLGSRFLGHPYGLETGYYVKPTVFADVTNDSSTTLSKGSLRGKRGEWALDS